VREGWKLFGRRVVRWVVLVCVGVGWLGVPVRGGAVPPVAVVSVGDAAVMEGASGARQVTVPVTLSRPAVSDVVVSYVVEGGSATAGVDFEARRLSGRLRFGQGNVISVRRGVVVKVVGDELDEDDETITVRVVAVSGRAVVGRAEGTVTVLDDDSGKGQEDGGVAVGDVTVVEGDEGGVRRIRLPVTLAAPLPNEFTVRYDVTPGTASASEDFVVQRASGTVRIPAGALRGHVEVIVLADTLAEDDESVLVTLSNPSAFTVSRSVGTLTILDDDEEDDPGSGSGGGNGGGGGSEVDGFDVYAVPPEPLEPFTPMKWSASRVWSHVDSNSVMSCGVQVNRSLWCWGFGVLGDGDTARYSANPVQVDGDGSDEWSTVAVGVGYACAIDSLADLYCWGDDGNGRLGLGTVGTAVVPGRVVGPRGWQRVSVGTNSTCAIRIEGSLWCWGRISRDWSTAVPAQMGSDYDWQDVSVSRFHACGIRSAQLWCWGSSPPNRTTPYNTMSGNTFSAVRVQGATEEAGWKAISVSYTHLCGIRTDRSAWCAMWEDQPQEMSSPQGAWLSIVAVFNDADYDQPVAYSCGIISTLAEGNTLRCWRADDRQATNRESEGRGDWITVSQGRESQLGVLAVR